MKVIKLFIFIFIFSLSIFFLFPEVSLKFILFNMTLLLLFFFPFYYWVTSIKTLALSLAIVFIITSGLLFLLRYTPDKKIVLGKIQPTLNIEPTVGNIQFEWSGKDYEYDFAKQQLLVHSNKKISQPLFIHSSIFTSYYLSSSKFISQIQYKSFSKLTVSTLLWLLSIILLSFICSQSTSLLVSYSNIVFLVIPYAVFSAKWIFFPPFPAFLKSFTPIMLYVQIALVLVFMGLGFIRVRH